MGYTPDISHLYITHLFLTFYPLPGTSNIVGFTYKNVSPDSKSVVSKSKVLLSGEVWGEKSG